MITTVPEIVAGVTRGDSDAWERAGSLLTTYYAQSNCPRVTLFSLTSRFSPSFSLTSHSDTSLKVTPCYLRDCDLLALANLGIKVAQDSVNQLFASEPLPELMAQIPLDTQLVDAPEHILDTDGALNQLWTALTKDPLTLKPKAAAAILARLRPATFPLFSRSDRLPWGEISDYLQFCQDLHDLLLADRGRLAHQLYYLHESLELPTWVSQIQLLQALVFSDYQADLAAHQELRRQEKATRKAERAAKKLRKKQAKQNKKQHKKLSKQEKSANLDSDLLSSASPFGGERAASARHLAASEPADLGNSRSQLTGHGRHVRNDGEDGFISTDPVSL